MQGVFGGGLALHIGQKYSACEKFYKKYLKNSNVDRILGNVCFWKGVNTPIIANCFSQRADFVTNYISVRKCFKEVEELALRVGVKTVGIPYKYGCGIAVGEWRIVEKIIIDTFENSSIECQIWQLEG